MARGNQRDLAREKNLKKAAAGASAQTGDPLARNAANASALAEKVARKQEAAAAAAAKEADDAARAAASGAAAAPSLGLKKKAAKKDAGLDTLALLEEGAKGGKGKKK
jgi:colicin import membrane protein